MTGNYYISGTKSLTVKANNAANNLYYNITGIGEINPVFDTTTVPNGKYCLSVTTNPAGIVQSCTDIRYRVDFSTLGQSTLSNGRADGGFLRPPDVNEVKRIGDWGVFDSTYMIPEYRISQDLFLTTEFSLSAWVNPSLISTTSYFGLKSIILIKSDNSAASIINYGVQLSNSTTVQFVTRVRGNSIAFYGFTVPDLMNKESHIAFTIRGSNISFYFNGEFKGTQSLLLFTDPVNGHNVYIDETTLTSNLTIGGGISVVTNGVYVQNTDTMFKGALKDIRIYGRCLNAQQILNVYENVEHAESVKTIVVENIPNANTIGGTPKTIRGVNTEQEIPILENNRLQPLLTWGVNGLRIMVNTTQEGMTFEESWVISKTYVENMVILCRDRGWKAVIDIQDMPVLGYNSTSVELWDDPVFEPRLIQIWTELTTMLIPYSDTIWAFDLINELCEPRQGMVRSLWVKLITVIRAIDQNVWIIYEPPFQAAHRPFEFLTPLPDKRIIYSFHYYDPVPFCLQGISQLPIGITYPSLIAGVLWDTQYLYDSLNIVKAFQTRYDVPVYVGEFSCIRWADHESSMRWFRDVLSYFETAGWSWTYVIYKGYSGWDLLKTEVYPDTAQNNLVGEAEQLTLLKSYFALNAAQ